ncbi:MAG: heme lyase CcmF/NrfE family subunit [Gammaproteobacteria bacterium]|nr:MAG: heme lyase CcmF/NrfE family subunit [Gammaproteobacteria bacterium]
MRPTNACRQAMILETGNWALHAALAFALATSLMSFIGVRATAIRWARWCIPSAIAEIGFLALAYVCLTSAFISHDFSSAYVAANSNIELPLVYRITAVWGEHEGSLLLWVCLLGVWTGALICYGRRLPPALLGLTLGILGLITAGICTGILLTANPFATLTLVPENGNDLNPLLQDPAMAIHPPLLYAGYAGAALPFAFAVAMLLLGRIEQAWFHWLRPFATAGWMCLTLGIAVGSGWSYYELGWGGWWFWDPVENASFMPWLISTALVHSIAVTAKRGIFMNWTLLLSITIFSLSLVGTFLARAGALASVHTFATAPGSGQLLLGGFTVLIAAAVIIYIARAKHREPTSGFAVLSRETFLLANNLLLTIAAGLIFVGTFYPVMLSTFGLARLSVGAPWFEAVFLIPMLPLLFAVAIGMQTAWGTMAWQRLARKLRWPLVVSISMGIGLPVVAYGSNTALTAVGVAAACGLITTALLDPVRRLFGRGPQLTRGLLGMQVAHLGLGLTVLGMTVSTAFGVQADRRIVAGQTVELGEYAVRLVEIRSVRGPNYHAIEAAVQFTRDGRVVAELTPQKRTYAVRNIVMTEAGIDARWRRDLFVALGDDLGRGAWSMRLQYRPLIRLIWCGAVVMALGGLIALMGRRRSTPTTTHAR